MAKSTPSGLDENDVAVLEGLSKDELAELEGMVDMMDPERSYLDAGSRQESTTAKKPTGPYDRERLLRHMRAEAERSTVGNDWLVYNGEKKGKAFGQPKQTQQARAPSKKPAYDSTGDDELDALLAGVEGLATEQDLEDLAGTLGINDMSVPETVKYDSPQGIKHVVKATVPPKIATDETDGQNETDVDGSVRLLSTNDPSLVELNLNNHPDVTNEHLQDLCRSLLSSTHLTKLLLVGTGVDDRHARLLGEALEYNRTLKVLNLESNRLSAVGITHLLKALRENSSLEELRLNNQNRPLGNQTEADIAEMLEHNRTLRKIGLSFKSAGPRSKVDRLLLRNNDLARQRRVSTAQVSYS